MLRKKNIVLNDAKASGSEILSEGDTVKFYLSDETFYRFSQKDGISDDFSHLMPPIVYEDDDIILVNKPSGMLSQRSSSSDVSLNEICLSYMKKTCPDTEDTLKTYTPSVCNRLDRNTSGIVIFAKSYRGARHVSEAIRDHSLKKYYRCIVSGCVKDDMVLTGRLIKDENLNTVKIKRDDADEGAGIKTIVHPVSTNDRLSLLDITLITGKTHQIRAHMASVGHPIIGDAKYGNKEINLRYRTEFGIDSQMLVCYRISFPDDFALKDVANKFFEIKIPEEFGRVMA